MTIAFIVRYDPSCSLLSYATPAVTGQAGQLTRCWISTEELSLSLSLFLLLLLLLLLLQGLNHYYVQCTERGEATLTSSS